MVYRIVIGMGSASDRGTHPFPDSLRNNQARAGRPVPRYRGVRPMLIRSGITSLTGSYYSGDVIGSFRIGDGKGCRDDASEDGGAGTSCQDRITGP
jgi:hypothetical protein